MLLNTTSFLVSHIRTSISATVHSTNSLYTSLKSSLGLVNAASTTTSQNSPRHKDEISSSSPASSAVPWYDQEIEGNQIPLGHEQYPSLQPWRGLNRRIKNYGYTAPVASTYTAPRYPIVLCHGLFGFDKLGPESIPPLQIHYWNGVEKALAKLGAKVVVAGVPRTGAIKKRAEDLHKMLSSTMAGMPVNFIAHSMGGLDCRYLISHIHDKNYDVQSLTTLSTPHRGSPMMDWFRDNVGVGSLQQAEEEAMRKLVQMASDAMNTYSDHSPNLTSTSTTMNSPPPPPPPQSPVSPLLSRLIPFVDTPAYANLTTTYCNQVFNPNTPDDPRVSYYSYGASLPEIPLWAPLGFPWEVIKAREGENDGLVSTQSARWGHYIETVEADHWDLNNRWRLKIGYSHKPFDAVDFYMNVATRLYKEGY
ncbi:hypothetical protein BG011_002829 [Mortierella polycephala]|uniref:DUF676 domain-containing protein n=1 Tax=Mortierella polycephala TaxID=41804 RepID=A0A9P6U4R7_9FUNG|nr:hypothetical protein BG011_002829 [Mortierella polycephala]